MRDAAIVPVGMTVEQFIELVARRVVELSAPSQERSEVLASVEARARGFRHTEAFLVWCARRGVPVRIDGGKVRWVRPADVSRAVLGMPLSTGGPKTEEEQGAEDARDVIEGRRGP